MAKVSYISGLKSAAQIGLAFNGAEITAQSTPVLDAWGWGEYWGCEEWIAWHQSLVTQFGAAQATQIFKQAWEQQTIGAHPLVWCQYDALFHNYFKQYGITFDPSSGLWITAENVVNSAGDIITNLGSGASFLSGLIKPIGLLALIGGSIYVYKNYIK